MHHNTYAGRADRDLLRRILEVQSVTFDCERMRAFVREQAAEIGAEVREDRGNLYLRRGEAAVHPCLVAHLDTVHAIVPDDQYAVRHDPEGDRWFAWNPVRDRPTGVGGDDKVGIFIALTLLRDLPAAKVALFRDEEQGRVGAHEADLAFFDDCAFAIEADRMGSGDFVRSIHGLPLYDDRFADAIAPILDRHGYAEVEGGRTDVYTLADRGMPLACANLSCGYYHPHSPEEEVRTADVLRALALVRDLCDTLGDRPWHVDRH